MLNIMKKIINFIKESFEENTFWKIDKYFERHQEELKKFNEIIDYFRALRSFNSNDIKNYIEDNKSINLKPFVDFLDDIIKQDTTNMDYNYRLYLIIKYILSHKEESDKYTNKK